MVLRKKQKRLIFFLPNFVLGGAGESIFKLSKFLIKYNFSILIISLGKNFYKKNFEKINCEIIIKEILKIYDNLIFILKLEPSPKVLENSRLCPFFESNLSTIARPNP